MFSFAITSNDDLKLPADLHFSDHRDFSPPQKQYDCAADKDKDSKGEK